MTHTNLCALICGPTNSDVLRQLRIAKEQRAEMLEWRFDLFDQIDFAAINSLKKSLPISSIFVLRSKKQGGGYSQSESSQLELILKLSEMVPDYIDLEKDTPAYFVEQVKKQFPQIKIILSHHDFSSTPADLDAVLNNMKRISVDYYKITTFAQCATDALRMLNFIKNKENLIVGICMGEYGQLSRIYGPTLGNKITFAATDERSLTASGQLLMNDFQEVYQLSRLKSNPLLCGLIGNPVEKSFSHLTHNATMKALQLNAVYAKMKVQPEELSSFLNEARSLPFQGMSVTMPLKELVIPHLDQIDPKAAAIGAVNTLCFNEGKIVGYNTDASGALNAIESVKKVLNHTFLILGAGGASRAIAFEAKQRGANVFIANRHPEKAKKLASTFNCYFCEMGKFPKYDFIVNATPAPMPIEQDFIQSETVAMDIVNRPPITQFLAAAKEKHCQIVPGYKMFVEQAVAQFNHWFNLPRSTTYPHIHLASEKALSLEAVLTGK